MFTPSTPTSIFVATHLAMGGRVLGTYEPEEFGDCTNSFVRAGEELRPPYSLYEVVIGDPKEFEALASGLASKNERRRYHAVRQLEAIVPRFPMHMITEDDIGYGQFDTVIANAEEYTTIGAAGYGCYVAVPKPLKEEAEEEAEETGEPL